MRYRVEVRRSAEKALKKLDRKAQHHIYERLVELGDEPRGHKCKKLAGEGDRYRAVVWPYRILYSIDDGNKVIDVFVIAHRKEAYR